LRCHYCGHDERVPVQCPSCGNQDLLPVGQGTQRIEATLAERFPAARIARVDRDTTRNKDAFDQLRERVTHDELDILVGTQMLAKGHDFPRLTLVAVLGIDAALFAPDFRAEERLFSLMLQVIGRAGRADLPGEALIQTTLPTHPFFAELLSQDYAAFADRQLRVREQSGFPPYSHQAVLRAEGNDEHPVFEFLRAAAGAARAMDLPVIVHDPVPAWIARLAGRWRGQVLIQSEARGPLQALLRDWTPSLTSTRVRWSIDVDPNEL
jgi:primosomal protein N' (replication factor Y)